MTKNEILEAINRMELQALRERDAAKKQMISYQRMNEGRTDYEAQNLYAHFNGKAVALHQVTQLIQNQLQ